VGVLTVTAIVNAKSIQLEAEPFRSQAVRLLDGPFERAMELVVMFNPEQDGQRLLRAGAYF
jgi:hypothetical protein